MLALVPCFMWLVKKFKLKVPLTWAMSCYTIQEFYRDESVAEPLEEVEHDEIREADVQIP